MEGDSQALTSPLMASHHGCEDAPLPSGGSILDRPTTRATADSKVSHPFWPAPGGYAAKIENETIRFSYPSIRESDRITDSERSSAVVGHVLSTFVALIFNVVLFVVGYWSPYGLLVMFLSPVYACCACAQEDKG